MSGMPASVPGPSQPVREQTVRTPDGIDLHTQSVGGGDTVLFIHEFAGDLRSWEPQVRRFSRSYHCVTYNARGYPPSGTPDDPAAYSQQHALSDAVAVLDGLGVQRAHVFGNSMGGFAALFLAMRHPQRVRSAVAAGTGYGAHPEAAQQFRKECTTIAARLKERGVSAMAREYMSGPARVQYQNKDPIGWERLVAELGQHSTTGSVMTLLGVQRERPSLHDLERDLAAVPVPVLILAGDEDDGCLDTSLWLKRVIPRAGLAVVPKSGHTVNLEEPDIVNGIVADFWNRVGNDAWGARDPRAVPGSITGIND